MTPDDDGRSGPYVIRIVRLADGTAVDISRDDWGDGSLYWWSEGNGGCDCNRHLYFERALGNAKPDIDDLRCGDRVAYRIPHVTFPNGDTVTIDD